MISNRSHVAEALVLSAIAFTGTARAQEQMPPEIVRYMDWLKDEKADPRSDILTELNSLGIRPIADLLRAVTVRLDSSDASPLELTRGIRLIDFTLDMLKSNGQKISLETEKVVSNALCRIIENPTLESSAIRLGVQAILKLTDENTRYSWIPHAENIIRRFLSDTPKDKNLPPVELLTESVSYLIKLEQLAEGRRTFIKPETLYQVLEQFSTPNKASAIKELTIARAQKLLPGNESKTLETGKLIFDVTVRSLSSMTLTLAQEYGEQEAAKALVAVGKTFPMMEDRGYKVFLVGIEIRATLSEYSDTIKNPDVAAAVLPCFEYCFSTLRKDRTTLPPVDDNVVASFMAHAENIVGLTETEAIKQSLNSLDKLIEELKVSPSDNVKMLVERWTALRKKR